MLLNPGLKPLTDEVVSAYTEYLSIYPSEVVEKAVGMLVDQTQYGWPGAGQIKQKCDEILNPPLDTERLWNKTWNAIQDGRRHDEWDLVKSAVDACGGFWDIQHCPTQAALDSMKRTFVNHLKNAQQKQQQDLIEDNRRPAKLLKVANG